jgi:hypothetical protein
LILVGAVVLVAAQGRRDRAELPSPAVEAVRRLFPNAEVEDVDREDRGGMDSYKVEVQEKPRGKRAEIEVLSDGLVLRVEEDWPIQELPAEVLKGLRRSWSKAQIQEVRKRTRIDVSYELEVVQEGKRRELRISHTGRVLEIEKRD